MELIGSGLSGLIIFFYLCGTVNWARFGLGLQRGRIYLIGPGLG